MIVFVNSVFPAPGKPAINIHDGLSRFGSAPSRSNLLINRTYVFVAIRCTVNMNYMSRKYRIICPRKRLIHDHEMMAAIVLITKGDVRFLEEASYRTPDIYYLGEKWEIKSPTGNSSRTIENNIRNALRQSDNIIIDLRRMHVNENKCLKEVERQVNLFGKRVRKMLVIVNDDKIKEIK